MDEEASAFRSGVSYNAIVEKDHRIFDRARTSHLRFSDDEAIASRSGLSPPPLLAKAHAEFANSYVEN